MKYLFCILLLFLSSCSPQKRLARLIERNPNLLNVAIKDSVNVRHFSVNDSSFFLYSVDSILIKSENTSTKIFRHYDSFFVISKTDPCTTYIRQNFVQGPVNKKREFPLTLLLIVFCLFLLVILTLVLRK